MHYTAMAAAIFMPVDALLNFTEPRMDPPTLAIIISVTTFFILGSTLLTSIPDKGEVALESVLGLSINEGPTKDIVQEGQSLD